jgi:hypothetical protein
MGVAIVVALGLIAGAVLCPPPGRPLPRIVLAAVLASLAWIAGVYVLLALTAPHELGPPLAGPLVAIVLSALAGAALGARLRRGLARRSGSRLAASDQGKLSSSGSTPT